jgi:antagonist of KipI
MIAVLASGLQTTVQDPGRTGHRRLGVGTAGALDGYSLRVANMLVGNAQDAAALEITLQGPRLHFHRATRLAITGADIDAHADGVAIPGWRPVDVRAGCELVLGPCRRGARAYLAIAGGIDVGLVLGSAATDLRAGFGGFAGRALMAGDVLKLGSWEGLQPRCLSGVGKSIGAEAPPTISKWWIDPTPDLDLAHALPIRLLRGHDALHPADALTAQPWRVTAQSNRQGLRLQGEALALAETHERLSEPVAPGTVQLPPDGQPIVLLGEAQTIGGYPRIGHVIAADLPRLAQRRPGDVVLFEWIDAAAAMAAACAQRHRLTRIGLAIEQRRREA